MAKVILAPKSFYIRGMAMNWWNSLEEIDRHTFAFEFFNKKSNDLTGIEIEFIWNINQNL